MEGKTREVIQALLDVMYDMGIDEETVAIAAESTSCHMKSHKVLKAIRNAKSALAEPHRQCDVGTAEEQLERYEKFCDIHDCRIDCPLFKADCCEFAWAQMPYEAERQGEGNGSI